MNRKLLQGWGLIGLSLFTLLVYLFVAWFVNKPAVFITPDEGGKFLQMQNLGFANGEFIDDIPYGGQDWDANLRYAPRNDDWGLRVQDKKLNFGRIPLFGLVVRPLFDLFGYPGLYLLPALSGVACSLLAMLILKPSQRRLEMWLLIAFGSPIFIYSVSFWEHTLAVALAMLTVWLALNRPERHVVLRWLIVGSALGLSIYLRLEMGIFALAFLASYLVIFPTRRRGPLVAIGLLALVVASYVTINAILFQQPLPDNTRFLLYPFFYFRQVGLLAVKELLVGPAAEGAIDTGWLGDLWATAAIVAIAHSFTRPSTPAISYLRVGGTIVTMIVAAWFLFSPNNYFSAHGLLFTTPWVLLGVIRAREIWLRESNDQRLIVGTVILGLVGYTIGIIGFRAASPHGGLEWGARYAIAFIPLLAILAGWKFTPNHHHVLYLVVGGGMLFLGLGFQVRGIVANRHSNQVNEALYALILDQPDEHILFNEWWLPLNAAPVYSEKNFYLVSSAAELKAWTQLARQNEIRSFTVITTDSNLLGLLNKKTAGQEIEIEDHGTLDQLNAYRLLIQE